MSEQLKEFLEERLPDFSVELERDGGLFRGTVKRGDEEYYYQFRIEEKHINDPRTLLFAADRIVNKLNTEFKINE